MLNGNGTAPMQTGSVAADVTVTDDISVAQASDVLGTTYDVLDDAATVASARQRVTKWRLSVRRLLLPTVARLT